MSSTRPPLPPEKFTFIDLFAGIGGMRIAFEDAGGRCVFSSEWDRWAQATYEHNFGERPAGDIRSVEVHDVPAHDILVAGFPCQPFSIAGVSKKNALGRPHGFEDETQGTLFYEIERVVRAKKPRAVFLENVRNILSHDNGHTIEVIKRHMIAAGYTFKVVIESARPFVPQSRVRVFMVCFRRGAHFQWDNGAWSVPTAFPTMETVLDDRVPAKYTLSQKLWDYLQGYAAKHRAAKNGFGYGLAERDGIARTLSARYYKDGSEILVPQEGKPPRRLTPNECRKLMGFKDWFEIPLGVSDTQAYKQFGNSVVVPLVHELAKAVVDQLPEAEPRDPDPSARTAEVGTQAALALG